METLKQIRERIGIKQAEIARRLDVTIPALSSYESGVVTPPLESCILIERDFSVRLDWQDKINDLDKAEIINDIVTLSKHYPLSAVLNFAVRHIKQDQRINQPGRVIRFYTEQSNQQEVLLPPDVNIKQNDGE